MEAALGFLSYLYPTSDNILHGDLAQIGSLLSKLNSAKPLRLRMTRDGY
jgi:hypothetical protein